jgi:hypothetical protein
MDSRLRAFALALVLFVTVLVGSSSAATTVSGVITQDTIWTKSGSPYVLSGFVQVADEVTLSVEPGVIVEPMAGSGLTIAGTLRAIGSSSDPIVVSGVDWSGIDFFDQDPYVVNTASALRYVRIEHATTALDIDSDSPEMVALELNENRQGIRLHAFAGDVSISDSVFTKNEVGISGSSRKTVSISNNAFWMNGTAISISYERSCACEFGRWDIHGNDLLPSEESPNGIAVGGESAVTNETYDASSNWWGTTDPAVIEARLYDGDDDVRQKQIIWEPPSSVPHTSFEPPPEPQTFQREISLSLRRHLVATGVLTMIDPQPECQSGNVNILRRYSTGWRIIFRSSTRDDGSFRVQLPDRSGRYRAELEAKELNESTNCGEASSDVVRHRH